MAGNLHQLPLQLGRFDGPGNVISKDIKLSHGKDANQCPS